MKLTLRQEDALLQLAQDKVWFEKSINTPHRITVNSLVRRGMISERTYANGIHWDMTDKGKQYLVDRVILKRK